MPDIKVGAQITVDTSTAIPSVKEVRENIKQLKSELDNAKVGTEEHKKALDKLAAANSQLNPVFKEQSSTFQLVGENLKKSVPAFGAASEGATGFGSTLKALMANPIVLLVAAITAGLKFLYDAFTSTAAGAKQMEQIFSGLTAVVENIGNRFIHLGRAVIEFFKGNWGAAADEAKAAVSNVAGDIADTYNKAVEVKKKRQQLNKELKEEEMKTLIQKEHLADLKAQLADEDITAKEKIKIAQQVKEEQKKLSDDIRKNASKNLDVSLAEAALKYGTTEAVAKKVADLQIRLLQAVTEEEKKQIKDQINELGLKAKNQIEFTSAIKDAIKEQHETSKAANDDERAANRAAKAANKQFRAEESQANQDNKAKAREAEQNHKAFIDKLETLHQENLLARITDADQKKLKELDVQFSKEKQAIEADFRQMKITKEQHDQLMLELTRNHNLKVSVVNDEYRKQEYDKQLQEQTKAYQQQKQDQEKQEAQRKTDEQTRRDLSLRKNKLEADTHKNDFSFLKKNLEGRKSLIDYFYHQDLAAAGDNALEKQKIEMKHQEEMAALANEGATIAKAESDAKIQAAQATGSALGALSDLIGQHTAAGKAMALAQIGIDTAVAISGIIKQASHNPTNLTPFQLVADVAIRSAAVLANVAKAKSILSSVNVSGGGGGGSLATAAPLQLQPQVTTTQLNAATIQAIGNAAGNRAFVVEADMTNNQERRRRLTRAARLG